MSKIKRITVQNLKAVSKMTADFNGCTAIITGANDAGKSSFLKSFPERIRGIKTKEVLKHNEGEGSAELHLTTGEKFFWKFNKDGKEKLTFVTERNITSSVTKDISDYYFPKVFDIDKFMNQSPAEKRATLEKYAGIDFSELNEKYKEAYDLRTFRNKRLIEEKAKAQYIDPMLPEKPIDVSELEKELSNLEINNLKIKNFEDKMNAKQVELKSVDDAIRELQLKIEQLEEKKKVINNNLAEGETWLKEHQHLRIDPDKKAALEIEVKTAKEKNKLIEANQKAKEQDIAINKASMAAEEADREVKRIEKEKDDTLKYANLPEGFGFNDIGITYNGYDFNRQSLSSSALYIAALKLACIGLGEVRTLHFDASFLDKKNLEEIEKWANENDLQLLIERPAFEGGEITYEILK